MVVVYILGKPISRHHLVNSQPSCLSLQLSISKYLFLLWFHLQIVEMISNTLINFYHLITNSHFFTFNLVWKYLKVLILCLIFVCKFLYPEILGIFLVQFFQFHLATIQTVVRQLQGHFEAHVGHFLLISDDLVFVKRTLIVVWFSTIKVVL